MTGVGGQFANKSADLFMGNAGTAIRPLTAALALQGGAYTLSGVPRMHERPIGDLVDGLRAVGANIDYLGTPGFPPLKISPADIRLAGPVKVRGDVSSQFLTALLMALPLTGAAATIEVVGELISKPYVDITLNLMQRFGVTVARDDWRAFHLPAGSRYTSPGTLHVEGDASSASYFLAAGALGGGPVRVQGVGRASIQGDVRFADALSRMGANLMAGDDWIEVRGHERAKLAAIDADFNHIPDAAMTIAVLALFADGPSTPAQHRRLAGEGDRPHHRDGDRAGQAGSGGGGGRRLPARYAAGKPSNPPPSTPTTTTGWRCAFRWPVSAAPVRHQRSAMREQDLPRIFRRRVRAHRAGPLP